MDFHTKLVENHTNKHTVHFIAAIRRSLMVKRIEMCVDVFAIYKIHLMTTAASVSYNLSFVVLFFLWSSQNHTRPKFYSRLTHNPNWMSIKSVYARIRWIVAGSWLLMYHPFSYYFPSLSCSFLRVRFINATPISILYTPRALQIGTFSLINVQCNAKWPRNSDSLFFRR